MAALYAIAMCSAIIIALPLVHDPIETFKELFGMEEAEFIAFVRDTFLEKLPLGNLVANACENVNLHIGIIPGVQEVGNMNLVDFLLDCVTATIAGTIAYFFNSHIIKKLYTLSIFINWFNFPIFDKRIKYKIIYKNIFIV